MLIDWLLFIVKGVIKVMIMVFLGVIKNVINIRRINFGFLNKVKLNNVNKNLRYFFFVFDSVDNE